MTVVGGATGDVEASKVFFAARGAALTEDVAMELAEPSVEELQTIVLSIFREICAFFQPMMASEAILNTSAAAIRKRINNTLAARGPLISKVPTARQTSYESKEVAKQNSCDSKGIKEAQAAEENDADATV